MIVVMNGNTGGSGRYIQSLAETDRQVDVRTETETKRRGGGGVYKHTLQNTATVEVRLVLALQVCPEVGEPERGTVLGVPAVLLRPPLCRVSTPLC